MAVPTLWIILLAVMIVGKEGAQVIGLTAGGQAQEAGRVPAAYTHLHIPDNHYEDYLEEEEEEEEMTSRPDVGPQPFCDYDPCGVDQVPCSELQKASPCMCPGLSSEDEVPDRPRLTGLGRITASSAFVHWCEPASVVDSYRLVYQALGSAHANQSSSGSLPAQARTYTLQGLASSTRYRVCILALNQAGESSPDPGDSHHSDPMGSGPCLTFTTAMSSGRALAISLPLVLAAAALLGAGAFLLWRRGRGRRGEARLGPGTEFGLQNPTFSRDEKVGELPK
ncbi:leucine-rich repeat neuronal protein 4-like [Chiloscyllium plagiosum]|uniref:leucine-rich repeat neuronal protein 4-like n=1 Tax=Chiloscyllium plagiosum TaxID=36176 RepID=UPI001CB83CDD|nr:leucine-rich repeat neuronal protein 4-like [Chiloscyllium plagiosum]